MNIFNVMMNDDTSFASGFPYFKFNNVTNLQRIDILSYFSTISILFHWFSLLFHRFPLRADAAVQAAVRGLVFGRFCAVKAIYTSANFGPAKSHRASRVFLRRFRVYNPIAGPQGPPLSVILLHGFLPFVFI